MPVVASLVRRIAIPAVAVMVLGLASPPAQAAGPTTVPAPPATTMSAEQCGKPVSQRTGDWACEDTAVPAPTVRTKGPTTSAITPMTQSTGYCEIMTGTPGCWTQKTEDPDHVAYFNTKNGAYGVLYGSGPTQLGRFELDTTWTVTGGFMMSTVYIRNSHATTKTALDAWIENGARNVVGRAVTDVGEVIWKNKLNGSMAAEAGRQVQFPKVGSYDNGSWDHEAVNRVTWQLPGWASHYWWVRVKSPVAHTNDKEIYRFVHYDVLPGAKWSAGHFMFTA